MPGGSRSSLFRSSWGCGNHIPVSGPRIISMHTVRGAVLILLALASTQARAQFAFDLMDDPVMAPGENAVTDDSPDKPAELPRFRVAVGGGVGVGPNFPGSDKYRVGLVPIVFAWYGTVCLSSRRGPG